MSMDQWRQRVADAQSRRRRLMDSEGKRAFDAYYGKQAADGSMGRNKGGAGKGDRRRPCDTLLYDIGYELSFNKDLTDDEREELTQLWERVKRERL